MIKKEMKRRERMTKLYDLEKNICKAIANIFGSVYLKLEDKYRAYWGDKDNYSLEKIIDLTYRELCKDILLMKNQPTYLIDTKYIDDNICVNANTAYTLINYSNHKYLVKYRRYCKDINYGLIYSELIDRAINDMGVNVTYVEDTEVLQPWRGAFYSIEGCKIAKLTVI